MPRVALSLALALSLGTQSGAWASEGAGLTGEQTRVSESVLTVFQEDAAELCDERPGAVRLSFTYEGVAEGPYPGTFTEQGYVVVGHRTPAISSWSGIEVATGPILAFGATFTIHFGDVVIEGRKWGLPPGKARRASLHCGTFVDVASVHAPRLRSRGMRSSPRRTVSTSAIAPTSSPRVALRLSADWQGVGRALEEGLYEKTREWMGISPRDRET
jgi:hypothetical protein